MPNIFLKNIIVLISIGLLIAIIVNNGVNFYQLTSKSIADVPFNKDVSLASLTKKLASPQTIERWHLFGINSIAQTEVPKSTLRLKITGIISSTIDGESRVIIEGSSRSQKTYKVGDQIKQNVRLKSIYPDHIVIIHNARQEIVPLKNLNTNKNLIKKVVIQ